jgi:hypothetical protein
VTKFSDAIKPNDAHVANTTAGDGVHCRNSTTSTPVNSTAVASANSIGASPKRLATAVSTPVSKPDAVIADVRTNSRLAALDPDRCATSRTHEPAQSCVNAPKVPTTTIIKGAARQNAMLPTMALSPFERAIELSCRKNARVFDPRLPGRSAIGKIIKYGFSADGDSGKLIGTVTIGCAIGFGGAITEVPGTPTYVEEDCR